MLRTHYLEKACTSPFATNFSITCRRALLLFTFTDSVVAGSRDEGNNAGGSIRAAAHIDEEEANEAMGPRLRAGA